MLVPPLHNKSLSPLQPPHQQRLLMVPTVRPKRHPPMETPRSQLLQGRSDHSLSPRKFKDHPPMKTTCCISTKQTRMLPPRPPHSPCHYRHTFRGMMIFQHRPSYHRIHRRPRNAPALPRRVPPRRTRERNRRRTNRPSTPPKHGGNKSRSNTTGIDKP